MLAPLFFASTAFSITNLESSTQQSEKTKTEENLFFKKRDAIFVLLLLKVFVPGRIVRPPKL